MKPMPEYDPSLHYSINLRNALECLRERARENPSEMSNAGICPNIAKWLAQQESLDRYLRHFTREKLDALIAKWPDNNGNENWPVGGAAEYYYEQSDFTLWHNPRRLELLDFLIEELSK